MIANSNLSRNQSSTDRLPNPQLLDRVVAELWELERRGGIQRTLAIGELILKQFFGGNTAAWRNRRKNKNNSIRRLANREDCPFSRSALNEAVAGYVASLVLPCVQTFGHIGASHITAVMTLPEEDRQRMLDRAERKRMSVRELKREVVDARRAAGERRGRPTADVNTRGLGMVDAAVRAVRDALRNVRDGPPLDAESLQLLYIYVTDLGHLLAEMRELTNEPPSSVHAVPSVSELRKCSA